MNTPHRSETAYPPSHLAACIDRFHEALKDPSMLNDDVVHLREVLENARCALENCHTIMAKVDKCVYWEIGSDPALVWSGNCQGLLKRITEAAHGIDGILGTKLP